MAPAYTEPSNQNMKQTQAIDLGKFLFRYRIRILIVLTLVGLFIRLYRIGFLALWVDEYVHATAAKNFAEKGIFNVADYNGFILTLVDCLFAKWFGVSEFVLRLPVAIAGTLLIPLTYYLGKKLFNTYVGLLAAVLISFSQFMVFWSRVDRMYEFVAVFYISSLLLFWAIYEKDPLVIKTRSASIVLKKWVMGVLLVITLILSFFSQFQSLLFFFSAGFYACFVVIAGLKKGLSIKLNRYTVLATINIIAFLLLFTPLTDLVNKPLLNGISADTLNKLKIPGWILAMLVPDWKAFGSFLSSPDWSRYFHTYYKVTIYDCSLFLGIMGWAGFGLSYLVKPRGAFLLIAGFIIPVVLMSIFLREPNQPRYICFIYPLFIISMAAAVYSVVKKVVPFLFRMKTTGAGYMAVVSVVTILVLIFSLPVKAVFKLVTSDTHGKQLSDSLNEVAFVNWKQPSLYVKNSFRKNDVLISTVPAATEFYVGAPSLMFRQQYYDLGKRAILPNPARPFQYGASSYDEFVKTVSSAPRGWLLFDHYILSAYIDPRVDQFIQQNLTYHFDASSDGSVKVYSWDKGAAVSKKSMHFIELGKTFSMDQVLSADRDDKTQYSTPLSFRVTNLTDTLVVKFEIEGIDDGREAAVLINEKHLVAIPRITTPALTPVILHLNVANLGLTAGINSISFVHFHPEEYEDRNPGFAVYDLLITNKR
jgi:4-amino-4-deoxy-L-arabinose transferase-like glycosyltransferase